MSLKKLKETGFSETLQEVSEVAVFLSALPMIALFIYFLTMKCHRVKQLFLPV